MEQKTALITGANTGIGLALAERLLHHNPSIHLCLACRNKSRAETARSALMTARPDANISILLVDISDLGSVYRAVSEIKKKFKRLDYLYLNAGIMPAKGVDWSAFFEGLFSLKCIHMFRTGDGLLKQEDGTTKDGLKKTFATNLFGHFVLVKQLEDMLGGADLETQIIWTSSSNAMKSAFDIEDIQHSYGREPYSSSKYASDLLSVALNQRLNKQGVYSHTTCPGLVMSNLTYGILPAWFWYLFLPLLWIMRLLVPSMTLDPYHGSESLFWLSEQDPASLNPHCKFHSKVTFSGRPYTDPVKMKIDVYMAEELYNKLSDLEKSFYVKFKDKL